MGKKNSKIYLFSHAAILHECATKIEVIQLRFSCTDSLTITVVEENLGLLK